MALIIVISTDFEIRWNVLSLPFSERESGKWPLGPSDFYHNYLIGSDSMVIVWKDIHLQHLIETISLCSNMTFFAGRILRSNYSYISVKMKQYRHK